MVVIASLFANLVEKLGKVIPCWLEENPEVKGTKELVKLSTHLLGFYSTWVDKMTLEQIVFEQTGEYTWIREPTPTFDQVEAFNEDLQAVHSKVSPFKHDSIPGKIEVSGDRWHNDAFAKAPRRGTKTIMGESANKVRGAIYLLRTHKANHKILVGSRYIEVERSNGD